VSVHNLQLYLMAHRDSASSTIILHAMNVYSSPTMMKK